METSRRHISIGQWILYAFAVLWSLITIYPLFWTVMSSLKTNSEIFGQTFKLPEEFHFEYYAHALFKANMGRSLLNSLFLTSATTLCTVVFASMAAFILARYRFKWINTIYIFFIAGLMIPIHSCMIPLVRTISAIKGQNSYLVMILLYTAFSMPLSVFLITGYMKGIPKELDEAAIIDGCGPYLLFIRIIMPLAAPILSTAGILTFLFTYNELIFAVLFISRKTLYTVSLSLLSFVGYRSTDYGPTFASVILSVVPMVIIYILFQEKVEKGLSAGAVKG